MPRLRRIMEGPESGTGLTGTVEANISISVFIVIGVIRLIFEYYKHRECHRYWIFGDYTIIS